MAKGAEMTQKNSNLQGTSPRSMHDGKHQPDRVYLKKAAFPPDLDKKGKGKRGQFSQTQRSEGKGKKKMPQNRGDVPTEGSLRF